MKWKITKALALSLSMLLALTACGGGAESTAQSAVSAQNEESAAPEEEPGLNANDMLADAKAFLTGALTTGDAEKLMQGNLDAVFRNITTDEYCEMVGSTKEELT